VVYNPVLEELYHAQVGKGAYLNGEPIHVTQEPLKDTLVATALPFKFRDKVDWITQLLLHVYPEVMDIRRLGSAALDICYTAAGIFGLYFEYGINAWDTAAGVCLLREAGGVALDFLASLTTLLLPRALWLDHLRTWNGYCICGVRAVFSLKGEYGV